jgi:hypothetical protein
MRAILAHHRGREGSIHCMHDLLAADCAGFTCRRPEEVDGSVARTHCPESPSFGRWTIGGSRFMRQMHESDAKWQPVGSSLVDMCI